MIFESCISTTHVDKTISRTECGSYLFGLQQMGCVLFFLASSNFIMMVDNWKGGSKEVGKKKIDRAFTVRGLKVA